ncbi:hypothetical protein Tco_1297835 [Tanacetum coccineum]
MFLLYELSGMLKELGLWDNNKIVLTHFRIPGMSLDDGLVLLMADADVIKSLIYVSGCKEIEIYIETGVSFVKLHLVGLVVNKSQSKGVGNGVVIEEIVEDNVVSSSGKDSRLFMLEWPEMGKDDEHVDISNHAPTYDVCPIVEPGNDENVKNLDCDNEVPITNPFSFRNMMEDSDVDVMRMLVVYTNSWLIVLWTVNRNLFMLLMNKKILPEMFAQLNHLEEGFVEDDKDNVFYKDANELPHSRLEVDIQHFHFQVDANQDQSMMFAVRLWHEFGPDVIDFDELYSGDEKKMSMLHNLKKESCGRLEENMQARKILKKVISL